MSTPVPIVPDKIHIQSIKILSANLSAGPEVRGDSYDRFDVQYGVSDELFFEEKLFRFVLSTHITALDANDEPAPVTGEYSIEYIFYVENLADYVVEINDKQDHFLLQDILIHTLLSIAYSTSRGIVLSRTQGTLMNGVILPVIDTRVLMTAMHEARRSAS